MLWMLLMAALLVLAIAAIIYIGNRIGKFKLIRKITKERKLLATLAGMLIAAGITAFLWFLWGSMNAIVCVLHLLVFWLVSEAIFSFIKKIRRKDFKRYYAGAAAIIFTTGYLACGWYLAHHVWETSYVIQTDKEVGNLKVAVFADSHVGATFDGDGFADRMEAIQAQNPDVLLIAGDFVDDGTSKEDMVKCCEALGNITTTYGVYYIFGNHDKGYYPSEYRGYDEYDLVAELEKNHVIVLEDDAELVDDRFYIIGRADRSEEYGSGRKTMEELTEGLDPDKFSIVLDHQPADYASQAASGVDLVLSGHTHGGQLFPLMTLENLIKFTTDDRVYGYEKRGDTNFLVTSGISDWEIKFKTGCKSEYLLIDIQGK